MRIFLTGASGFIGQHVVPLLIKDEHELMILERKSPPKNNDKNQYQTVIGDLKNLSRIKNRIVHFSPQACLHLAWEGIPDFSYEQSKGNLDCSMKLIQMLVSQTGCRKIIVSGSSWEYGKMQGICRESDESSATSFFTWAKNAVHTGGSLLCSQRDVDFVWCRIFFAFGPGQKKHALIPTLYSAFKNGKIPHIQNPHHAQDFIYVEDVAEAFRLAVKKPIPSGVYNIGREALVSVSDICSMVEKQILKRSSKTPSLKKALASTPIHNWADTSKFRLATDWSPRISIEAGIKNHIEFLEAT